ncbi:unnamed protein product [Mytilus edulis]|uniref:Reverse transcriptase domain-containing protein n=1 Tax=Mytilus edulis TaxID=6550 RepID=A0A8S3UZ42_MYTED|nr:unnamed protein product [Mytilus edulis]
MEFASALVATRIENYDEDSPHCTIFNGGFVMGLLNLFFLISAMAQVLKPNCSLGGKSLIPIILRVKNADAEAVLELSRLKKDEPLESLTKVELIAQFEKLTGESVKDVLIVLCGKDDNIENLRLLVHESILLANSVGARGQRSDGKAAQGDPSTTNQQLQAMRQDLDELKKNSKVLQVDEALSYVRTLAARPKLTTPGVLLAAIEMLVDAANKANHKDCSLFSKSFSMCKKYEDNVDFCGLVLKLFGSQEDKKISSLISDWAKSKKYEEPSGSKERQDILDAPPTSAPAFPFPGYGYQNPGFGFPYPNFYPGPNYNSGGFRPPRMQGGRGRRVSNGNIRDHEPLAKKEKFEPEIPDWELKSGFDPLSVKLRKQSDILLVNYKGEITQPSDCLPSAEEVVNGSDYDFEDLSFLDPNFFKAGNLMYCSEQWEKIGCPGEILDWIKQGVDIRPMFKHFKGNFRGRCYDSSLPQPAYFQNSASCKGFEKFLCDTLLERIANGSLTVIGRVGECDPPLLVLPITIEPSKPRMCHDERYLNLWIKDFPFSLDTLKEVPRLIEKDSFMASLDDKSGYDHILLNPNSRQYFGIQFAGWYMVFNSLPFGFKASAFIYHTTGLVPISYCRSLGVPSLLYIDDRLVCEFKNTNLKKKSGHAELVKSLYILCQVLVRLGYFLNLEKCCFIPTRCLKFLGMFCDSAKLAFILPEQKKESFRILRESILDGNDVGIKTLQRFAGKCISFFLAVPSARLFSREINRAISLASKNSKKINIYKELKEELEYWRFLDNWKGTASWRLETHLQLILATDSSLFKWGAFMICKEVTVEFGDFWNKNDSSPIHVKEANALLHSLCSVKERIIDSRVDAFCDNLAVVNAWSNQGGRDPSLNGVLRKIFTLSKTVNMDLRLVYVSSSRNPADRESRKLRLSDAMLSPMKWKFVEERFGPHTSDLMALDSNAMNDTNGNPLKHFTPFPTNGVPRVWLPAEQCLVCGYANDVGYQFCQSCGQNPVLIESSERITSNCSVERRLRYLDSLVGSTSYNKKKLSLEKEFEKFLFGGEPVKCLKTASPLDVRRFMVMKDSRGKTQVHDLTCEFLGKLGIHSCQCPLRLAAGTVQSMLGQLKAIFESNGRGSEWNEITKIGNPVCSPEVDKYLHAIQFEQSKSHVVQKQAKPLFLDKLRSISVHIDDLLLDPVLKSSERFIFLRDQAFFKVQYFSGDRANDLGLCISQEVKLLPNGDGFLFSHTVGKTLGKGKVNEFSILRFDDTLICPVKALERYVEGARALGVDLRFGYLFRTLSKNRKDVTDNPVSSNAMYDRLRKYLKKLDIYDGETPHGIRGACAITLALSGGSTSDVMQHIGWSSSSSYQRYSRLSSMVGRGSVSSIMANTGVSESNICRSIFESYCEVNKLSSAFQ